MYKPNYLLNLRNIIREHLNYKLYTLLLRTKFKCTSNNEVRFELGLEKYHTTRPNTVSLFLGTKWPPTAQARGNNRTC